MGQVGIVAVRVLDGAPVESQGIGRNADPVGIDIRGLHDILELELGGAAPTMKLRLTG